MLDGRKIMPRLTLTISDICDVHSNKATNLPREVMIAEKVAPRKPHKTIIHRLTLHRQCSEPQFSDSRIVVNRSPRAATATAKRTFAQLASSFGWAIACSIVHDFLPLDPPSFLR